MSASRAALELRRFEGPLLLRGSGEDGSTGFYSLSRPFALSLADTHEGG
jgi:hypothetical protein